MNVCAYNAGWMMKNISDLEREKKNKLSIPLWFIAQRLFPERCHLSAFSPLFPWKFSALHPPQHEIRCYIKERGGYLILFWSGGNVSIESGWRELKKKTQNKMLVSCSAVLYFQPTNETPLSVLTSKNKDTQTQRVYRDEKKNFDHHHKSL